MQAADDTGAADGLKNLLNATLVRHVETMLDETAMCYV